MKDLAGLQRPKPGKNRGKTGPKTEGENDQNQTQNRAKTGGRLNPHTPNAWARSRGAQHALEKLVPVACPVRKPASPKSAACAPDATP